MPSCPHRPLAASADTSDCLSPDSGERATHSWWRCSETMVTRCSQYCAGCTACGASYCASLLVALWCLVVWHRFVSALALAVYLAVYVRQLARCETEQMQLAQAVLAAATGTFAASDVRASAIVYLSFLAVILHVTRATLLMELMRLGDCRRCYSDALHCRCGSSKDPVPPGLLTRSAISIQAAWKRSRALAYGPLSGKCR